MIKNELDEIINSEKIYLLAESDGNITRTIGEFSSKKEAKKAASKYNENEDFFYSVSEKVVDFPF